MGGAARRRGVFLCAAVSNFWRLDRPALSRKSHLQRAYSDNVNVVVVCRGNAFFSSRAFWQD